MTPIYTSEQFIEQLLIETTLFTTMVESNYFTATETLTNLKIEAPNVDELNVSEQTINNIIRYSYSKEVISL